MYLINLNLYWILFHIANFNFNLYFYTFISYQILYPKLLIIDRPVNSSLFHADIHIVLHIQIPNFARLQL
jgi:hypothetical protein